MRVEEVGGVTIVEGDAMGSLRLLDDQSVNCCVTSPPYWGLRDYGTAKWEGGDPACKHQQGRPGAGRADGIVDERAQRNRDGAGAMGGDCARCGARRIDSQLGLEATPQEYADKMVAVFREVRRVLRDDGTLWLNLGDSYAANRSYQVNSTKGGPKHGSGQAAGGKGSQVPVGYKPKDLIGIPWRVAFALQADGWYLRQDLIWAKPNPMPESVRDRCTKSHEYIFLLAKSEKYYFDAAAISEPSVTGDTRIPYAPGQVDGRGNGHDRGGCSECTSDSAGTTRNKRSVWTVTTKPYREAHFATFPPDLIKPCVLAGCPVGGMVLDPFSGAGTTGLVAQRHGRRAVLLELNSKYIDMTVARIKAG